MNCTIVLSSGETFCNVSQSPVQERVVKRVFFSQKIKFISYIIIQKITICSAYGFWWQVSEIREIDSGCIYAWLLREYTLTLSCILHLLMTMHEGLCTGSFPKTCYHVTSKRVRQRYRRRARREKHTLQRG